MDLNADGAQQVAGWQQAAEGAERRFLVEVDSDLPRGATKEAQAAAQEAASELLSLPWELLHDPEPHLIREWSIPSTRVRSPECA